jgi:hypothetical protein
MVEHEGVAVRISKLAMWQTPLSIVSAGKVTPCASSSARAAATSSTCSAIGCVCGLNSRPNASDCMTAIVRVPVSNSPAGMFPQRVEHGRPSTVP